MDMHAVAAPLSSLDVTEDALCRWLGQAFPGDRLTYHRGFLAIDCSLESSQLSDDDRAELIRIRGRVLWAFERGLVHAVQQRDGPAAFGYMLIARPRARTLPR